MKKQRSAAYQLLAMVWKACGQETSHSWGRLNTAMHTALGLAVQAGMTFDPGDMAAFAEDFSSGRWIGNSGAHMTGEWAYCDALIYDNLSAAQSFEAWKQRPPFIVDRIGGAQHHYGGHFGPHGSGRLAQGFRFWWRDMLVTVTSFADDGQSITACTYKSRPDADGYRPEKIERRFKITYEALREEMTRRRKAAKAKLKGEA